MKERKSIDNFKEFVEDELFRDEWQIDEEVAANMELSSCDFPEDLDQLVMERIRQIDEKQKAYECLSEEDKEALRIGRESMLMRELEMDDEVYEEEKTNVVPFKARSKKAFLLVALVSALVFMFGMTGIGGPPFILEMMGVDVGEKEVTMVDSNQGNENEDGLTEEEKFEQEIRDTFNTDFVEMTYLPEKTKFIVGEIDKELSKACMLYEHEEKIIEYQIILNYQTKSLGYDIEDELIKEKTIDVFDVSIDTATYLLPNGEEQRIAQFKYKNAHYIINGVLPEAEFEEILKNLHFF